MGGHLASLTHHCPTPATQTHRRVRPRLSSAAHVKKEGQGRERERGAVVEGGGKGKGRRREEARRKIQKLISVRGRSY
jgi:hypothetical protein